MFFVIFWISFEAKSLSSGFCFFGLTFKTKSFLLSCFLSLTFTSFVFSIIPLGLLSPSSSPALGTLPLLDCV